MTVPLINLSQLVCVLKSEKAHHVVHNPTLCVPIFKNVADLSIIRLRRSLIKANCRARIVIITVIAIYNGGHLESLIKALIRISCYIMRPQTATSVLFELNLLVAQ